MPQAFHHPNHAHFQAIHPGGFTCIGVLARSHLKETYEMQEFRYDQFEVIGFSVPQKLIAIIDQRAACELISRAAWLRRLVLNELKSETRATEKAEVPA